MPQAKLPEILIDSLTQMGHTVLLRPPPYPSVNLVLKSGDVLSSQSDGRGGGYAVKYGPWSVFFSHFLSFLSRKKFPIITEQRIARTTAS
jgi:hypothetical protein